MTVTPWLLDLDRAPGDAACLDEGERARAAAFHRPIDRARFVARRVWLRRLLADYTGVAPAALRFDANAHGKPFLRDHARLRFSSSSAGAVGLCVVSLDGEVGCDIALRDEALADMAVAERLFSRAEHAALLALPPEERAGAFFNGWTRKEAYVKALGLGLSHPLDGFDVSLRDEPAPRLTHAQPGWQLRSLALGGLHHAAIAFRAAPGRSVDVLTARWAA